MTSKADYLKRYVSGGGGDPAPDEDARKKKRRRKKDKTDGEVKVKQVGAGVRILDEDADVQDCAVGEWLEEPCTEECGGGEQKLSRDVIAEPSANGAPCPPLELRRPCNDVPCPKDCQVDVWSEWSQCSKACGYVFEFLNFCFLTFG